MTHEISNKNTETRNKHCNHANKDLKSSRIFNWTPQLAANKKTEKTKVKYVERNMPDSLQDNNRPKRGLAWPSNLCTATSCPSNLPSNLCPPKVKMSKPLAMALWPSTCGAPL